MNEKRTIVADAELLRDMIVSIICQQKTSAMHEIINNEVKTENLIDFIYKEIAKPQVEGYDSKYIIMDLDTDEFTKLVHQLCMFLSYYVIKYRLSIPKTKNDDPFEDGEFNKIVYQLAYTLRYNMSLLMKELFCTMSTNIKGYRVQLQSRYIHSMSCHEIFTVFTPQYNIINAKHLNTDLSTLEIEILSQMLTDRINNSINDVMTKFSNVLYTKEKDKTKQFFYDLAHNELDEK